MINKLDMANVIGSEGYYKHDYNGNVYLKNGKQIEPVDGVFPLHLRKGTVYKTWPEIFPYVSMQFSEANAVRIASKKKKRGK